MATKKRKKLSKKQLKKKRSLAAKKGWETRRKRAYDARFAELNPELVGIEAELEKARKEGYDKAIQERIAKAIVDEQTRLGKVAKTPEAQIKARLRVVGGPDSDDYYEEVQELAEEYGDDYTPTEIYTMGFY
jgi:hypothetical protein